VCHFRARPANLTNHAPVVKAARPRPSKGPGTTKPRPCRTRLAALGAPGSRCRSGCPSARPCRPPKDRQCNRGLAATQAMPAPETARTRRLLGRAGPGALSSGCADPTLSAATRRSPAHRSPAA
jgi:hypothetical protein